MAASATARCWAGAWQVTGVRFARPWARQRHRGRRHEPGHDDTDRATGPTARDPAGPYGTRRPSVTPCPATGPTARDEPDGTRSGDGSYGTRRAIRDAIRQQALRHATIIFRPTMSDCPVMSGDVPAHFFWFYVLSLLAFCPAAWWCSGLMMFSSARLCSVMPDDVR